MYSVGQEWKEARTPRWERVEGKQERKGRCKTNGKQVEKTPTAHPDPLKYPMKKGRKRKIDSCTEHSADHRTARR